MEEHHRRVAALLRLKALAGEAQSLHVSQTIDWALQVESRGVRLAIHGCGALSPQQTNDWKWFKEAWDKSRADALGPAWGMTFAETMQGILKDAGEGTPNALTLFMHRETLRHLRGGIPMLRV